VLTQEQRLKLDPGPTPLYHQLEQDLRARIIKGEFSPGDPLPTEERICEQYGVSRITVRRALDALIAQSLIVKRRGVGSFVAEAKKGLRAIQLTGSLDEFLASAGNLRTKMLSLGDVEAPLQISGLLGLNEREKVTCLEAVPYFDDEPVGYLQIYFPLAVGHLLEPDDVSSETPIIRTIERKLNTRVARAEQIVEADFAGHDAARHLGLKPTTPVLRVSRVYYTAFEQPIEAALIRYHPERYRYSVDYRSSV